MKKFIPCLTLVSVLTAQAVSAQAQNFCSTTERQLAWFRDHPDQEKQYFSKRAEKADLLSQAKKLSSIQQYTIPVVFHILHKGSTGNISDAQVIDAVRILNRDYNKKNADTIELVPAYKGKAANVGIAFALAKLDPDGYCTNGIIRHEVDNTMFTGDMAEYQYTWPRESYLNIYVVGALPPEMNAAAFTYIPGSGIPVEMDAVVARNNYVGSIGSSTGFNSRVLTHEVGHWLGLEHVWGWDQVGVNCGDDYIGDTPETKGFTGCDSTHSSICFPPIVENFQNYMDYSYCCRMFTKGQADWMSTTIDWGTDMRDNLSTPSNLEATGLINIQKYCKTELKISPSPFVTACVGNTISLTTHTSVAPATSFTWTADNGAILLTPSAFSTGIVITNTGLVQVECVAGNGAGYTPAYLTINGISPQSGITTSNTEGFEELNIPQTWSKYGDKGDYWYVFQGASYDGYNSAYLKGEDLEPGAYSALESPGYDLSDTTHATFNFRYAYARATGYHQDIFKVQASSDCGTTWTDIYAPYIGAFAAVSAGIKSTVFIPEYKDWKLVDLGGMKTLKPFKGKSNVHFRFWFMEDSMGQEAGNRLYLDNINFATFVGLSKYTLDPSFRIFPQPSDGKFSMSFESRGGNCSYAIESTDGKTILQKDLGILKSGEQLLNLDIDVAPGLYLLRLNNNGKRITGKIVVN